MAGDIALERGNGVMVWELLMGEYLFQNIRDTEGSYSAKLHLAEMYSIIGPMPDSLKDLEKVRRNLPYSIVLPKDEGGVYRNAAEFFGGPFLTDEGLFVGFDDVDDTRELSDFKPDCLTTVQEQQEFTDFLKQALHWLPEKRMSAAELRDHHWLKP